MKRICTALLLLLAMSTWAQDQSNTIHATLYGIGTARELDTYLSPVEYRGPQLSILHESIRPTSQRDLLFQTLTQAQATYTHNAAGNGTVMGAAVRYDAGWHYQWHTPLLPGLSVRAGGMVGGQMGFLYNTRGSNNPAQAQAQIHLAASASARYACHIRRTPVAMRYQADMPLLGGAFTPQYGQSYYEIFSLGHYDHNVVCTHPGNVLSVRQQLSADIAVGRSTLRLAYLSDLSRSRLGGLRQHHYARSFMLGYVRQICVDRRRRREVRL